MHPIKVICGNFLCTENPDEFCCKKGFYMVIVDGRIQCLSKTVPPEYADVPVEDYSDALIIPGFCDLHTHAPQYENIGLGYDEELIPWLEKYTFPLESRFASTDYAKKIYRNFVRHLWEVGTTRALVFGTVHLPSSKILFDLFSQSGLGGYIGKVNMDRNCPDSLREETEESLDKTEEFIAYTSGHSDLVRPIVTPRFVPSTSSKLMTGLGRIAEKYDLRIQSHVSENRDEISWVAKLHPDIPSFTEVYEYHGLLRPGKTVLAHGIYLDEKEKERILQKNITLAHCPLSNTNMASGIMPVRHQLRRGISLGIGSDISGGHRLDMMSSVAGACQVSNLYYTNHPDDAPLSLSESFYLATKGGGRFFGSVGSFEPGYDADFLVIETLEEDGLKRLSPVEQLAKFIYAGSSDRIKHRFVRGALVHLP